MKIIQITPTYLPLPGGMQQRIKDLSDYLSKKDCEVEIFTSNIGCPKDKQLKSTKNLKIHYLKSIEFANTPIIPSLFSKLMKIPKDSVMHVHIAQAYIPEIVYEVWKKRKIPYIAHIRMDVEPSSFLGKLILEPYKKIFLKRFLKHASKIIVLNQDYFNLIRDKYGISENKIKIIPNATNFKKINTKYFIKKDKTKIIAVGRLVQQKNYFNLINSIYKLPKKIRSKIILNIFGEGSQKRGLLNLIKRLNLTKNIFLRGEIFGKDLERTYEKSDLFILVSHREGFSTTLIEAMSKGLPIIASNVIGNKCVIKDNYNGYLCETDAKSISKIIEKMVNNKNKWKTFSKNNLKEVKKYSWDKVVKQTEEVYREVLNEHNKK